MEQHNTPPETSRRPRQRICRLLAVLMMIPSCALVDTAFNHLGSHYLGRFVADPGDLIERVAQSINDGEFLDDLGRVVSTNLGGSPDYGEGEGFASVPLEVATQAEIAQLHQRQRDALSGLPNPEFYVSVENGERDFFFVSDVTESAGIIPLRYDGHGEPDLEATMNESGHFLTIPRVQVSEVPGNEREYVHTMWSAVRLPNGEVMDISDPEYGRNPQSGGVVIADDGVYVLDTDEFNAAIGISNPGGALLPAGIKAAWETAYTLTYVPGEPDTFQDELDAMGRTYAGYDMVNYEDFSNTVFTVTYEGGEKRTYFISSLLPLTDQNPVGDRGVKDFTPEGIVRLIYSYVSMQGGDSVESINVMLPDPGLPTLVMTPDSYWSPNEFWLEPLFQEYIKEAVINHLDRTSNSYAMTMGGGISVAQPSLLPGYLSVIRLDASGS